MKRLASLVVFALLLFVVSPALAQVRRPDGVYFDCGSLAMFVERIATYRDTGARLDPVLAMAWRREQLEPGAHRDAIEREIRRLWKERRPAGEAVADVYERCRTQLGDMGRDG